jgi:hypothetical protein
MYKTNFITTSKKLTIMNQTKELQMNYAEVGAVIDNDLASKMVKDFQEAYPNHQDCFSIGRNIIEKILSQPGVEGLRLYNGMDEEGNVSLVYVGADSKGNPVMEYTVVEGEGRLRRITALVADESKPIGNGTGYSWFS